MTGTTAKFFLLIKSDGGTGKIDSFSIVEYAGDNPREIKHPDKNVTITSGATTTMEIIYEKGVTKAVIPSQKLNNPDRIRIAKGSDGVRVYVPLTASSPVVITDVQGRRLAEFAADYGRQWYPLPALQSHGVYIISTGTGSSTMVKKVTITE
jgi:hypothetical protein